MVDETVVQNPRDYIESCKEAAELEIIRIVEKFALETGCSVKSVKIPTSAYVDKNYRNIKVEITL